MVPHGAYTHSRRAACDTSLGVANYSGIERQAFNLPASRAIYSLWPRLKGLDINKRYALIFSSHGSTSQPGGKNGYSLRVSTNNPYARGELSHSVDSGKTWQTDTGQDLLFAFYSSAPFKSGVK